MIRARMKRWRRVVWDARVAGVAPAVGEYEPASVNWNGDEASADGWDQELASPDKGVWRQVQGAGSLH